MLNKLSRYIIIVLIIVVSALYLPDFYSMLFDKKVSKPRMDYSAVIDEFVVVNSRKMAKTEYKDIKDNVYSEREFFKLLPFMYYATLDKWQELQPELKGFELTSKNIRRNTQFFSIRTKDINPPSVPLYIMFEAEPNYAQLMIPEDVFRLNSKIEFIDPVSNSVIEEKSARFQQAMLDAGFTFPANIIASNPTNRKPFDEGFFISDAEGYIYQFKMVKEEPVCIKTSIDPTLDIRQIKISENLRKEFYGWILTWDNKIYLITYDNYKLIQLPTTGKETQYDYNTDKMEYRYVTYPINKHIQIRGDGFINMMVLDNDYQPKAEHVITWTPYDERPASITKKYIFPFELTTYTPNKFIKLQMDIFWWQGLIGIGVSLLALVLFSRKRPWFDYVIVLFTGVFGLIGVLLIKPED